MIRVSEVVFARAPHGDLASGLLGWVSCTIDDALAISSIAVRRTRDGRLKLAFPERVDRRGCRHAYFRALNNTVREFLEREVFTAIGLVQEAAS